MASSSVVEPSSKRSCLGRFSASLEPMRLEETLIKLDGVTADQLETLTHFCQWVLEELDCQKNEITCVAAWADLCVGLGRTMLCKQCPSGAKLLPHFGDLGVCYFAPACSLGMKDIVDFRGTTASSSRATDMLNLMALIKDNDLVNKFCWLETILTDLQKLHLDLTGEWNVEMM